MNVKSILLLTSLTAGIAGVAGSVAYAQSYPPGPPPPPPDQGYDQGDPNQGQYADPGQGQDPYYQGDPGDDPSNDQDVQEAYSGQPVSVDFFYRQLAPYGDWIQRPNYGWVWYPSHVPAGWRPYRSGRWVESDYGWTWVSPESFGWATYHYGRWTLDPEYGWVWVPGTEWGPAWVSWQQGDGYIGWAPLPPSVRFRAGVGLDFGGINLSVAIGPSWYSFVPERSFLAPRLDAYFVPPARNVTIIHNTTNITNYTVVNNRIVNQSLSVQRVEQATGQRVQRLRIADASAPGQGRTARIQGSQLTIFRPRLSAAKPALAPPQAIAQARPARGQRPAIRPGQQTAQPIAPTGQAVGQINAQPRTGRPNNYRLSRRPTTPAEIQSQQEQEHQDLAKHQADEQRQLQQIHQQELQQSRNNPTVARETERRHQAESQALQAQQQGEKQQLEARHRVEAQRQPAQPRVQTQGNKAPANNGVREQPKERRDDRKPPPPPPQQQR